MRNDIMNWSAVRPLLEQSLAGEIEFPEILATLVREGVESYQIDFLRDECRYYARNGESLVEKVPFAHDRVAAEFSAEGLDAVNERVQAKQATFADFAREAPAVGCAFYTVYLTAKKVRYFGRDGGEYTQYLPGSSPLGRSAQTEGRGSRTSRSAIKSVDIAAPVDGVFDFLADPMNWPRYAVVNMRSVKPGSDGWFDTVTRSGKGRIKVSPIKELGIFDHTWQDPQASWTVPARVVPNQGGSTVMITIYQPAVMTDRQFDDAMREMDREMSTLKEILEASAVSASPVCT